jgi:tellurite resistance-related uncharacterized protein
MPEGLRRTHRLARATWGQINVYSGQLQFISRGDPIIDVVVGENVRQAIPPELEHSVRPLGDVRFSIEFFTVARGSDEVGIHETNETSPTSVALAAWEAKEQTDDTPGASSFL